MRGLCLIGAIMLLALATETQAADPCVQGDPRQECQINSPGWDDSPHAVPSGTAVFWMYSPCDFGDFILHGTPPVLVEPIRPDFIWTGNCWLADVYGVFRPDNSSDWGPPFRLALNTAERSECCAMYADGRIWLQVDTNIAVSNADWTGYTILPFSDPDRIEGNPHAYDGRVWFDCEQDGGLFDICETEQLPSGQWTTPMPVRGCVNTTTASEGQPWVENGVMRFSRSGTRGNLIAEWIGGRWRNCVEESLGDAIYAAEFSYMLQDGEIVAVYGMAVFDGPDLDVELIYSPWNGTAWGPPNFLME